MDPQAQQLLSPTSAAQARVGGRDALLMTLRTVSEMQALQQLRTLLLAEESVTAFELTCSGPSGSCVLQSLTGSRAMHAP